jgi:cytochrome c biogenesis factor
MFDVRPLEWIAIGETALTAAIPIAVAALVLIAMGSAYRLPGYVTAGRRGFYLLAGAMTLSIGSLAAAFLGEAAYDVAFVSSHSSTTLEWFFQLAGVWAGQEGSILFWCWILSMFGAALAFAHRNSRDAKMPWVFLLFGGIQLFFVGIVLLLDQNPFELIPREELIQAVFANVPETGGFRTVGELTTWLGQGTQVIGAPDGTTFMSILGDEARATLTAMADQTLTRETVEAIGGAIVDATHAQGYSVVTNGAGLNPLLANYWIAIHPPCMYVGYIGATVPFVFAIAGLIVGDLDRWARQARLWLLFCWFFLTVGNILGGLWAYEELGWGGFWAWDPVENAAILPWFTATAMLHSIMGRRFTASFRFWNIGLAAATFGLTILGTWITRSGMINSVHAFALNTAIGAVLLSFVGLIVASTTLLVVWRLPLFFRRPGDKPADEPKPGDDGGERKKLLTWDNMILAGNVTFLILAVYVVGLTLAPLISDRLGAVERLDTLPGYFITAPFFVLVFVFMGAAMGLGRRLQSRKDPWGALSWPTAMGVAGAIVALMAQFQFTALNFNELSTQVTLATAPGGAGLLSLDVLRALIMPLIPPAIVGTVVFVLLGTIMDYVATAKKPSVNVPAPRGVEGEKPAAGPVATETAIKPEAPTSAWGLIRRIGGQMRANRRRTGAYVVHLGALVMLVGIAASTQFKTEEPMANVPIGGAFTIPAGFSQDVPYTYTFRRYEVGARLAIDNDALAQRIDGPKPMTDDGREPLKVVAPGGMTGVADVVQVNGDGELPIAFYESRGALGAHAAAPDETRDGVIRRLIAGVQPGDADRWYLDTNLLELMALHRDGTVEALCTYVYGRSFLELRRAAPAIVIDLTALLTTPSGSTGPPQATLGLTCEVGPLPPATLIGRVADETPQTALDRIARQLTGDLVQLGVAVAADAESLTIRLTPTGVGRSYADVPSPTQRVPDAETAPIDEHGLGYLSVREVSGSIGLRSAPAVPVVPAEFRFSPTVRQYLGGRQQVTREPSIVTHPLADEFVVPTTILAPMEGAPANSPAVTGFQVHHNPLMPWNLLGVAILVLGTLICFLPDALKRLKAGESVQ